MSTPLSARLGLIVLGVVLLPGIPLAFSDLPADSIYVDVNWTNHPGSGTAANPFDRITLAVAKANLTNDATIAIADGLYRPVVSNGYESFGASGIGIATNMTLLAGFAGWTGGTSFDWVTRVPMSTLVDLGGANTRAFHVSGFDFLTAVFDGFTIRNGNTTGYGGAIDIPAPFNVTFNIKPYSTVLRIQNCLFTNNTAKGFGGAVFATSTVRAGSIVNCTFVNNVAGDGGTAEVGGGGLCLVTDFGSGSFVSNCLFRDNRCRGVSSFGGGMLLHMGQGTDFIKILGSRFYGNLSDNCGGGLFNRDGQGLSGGDMGGHLNVERCEFSDNTASNGAAVGGSAYWQGEYFLQNCLIVNNSGGYAVMNDGNRLNELSISMDFCTVADNPGGGVYCYPQKNPPDEGGSSLGLQIRNCIVAGNGVTGISYTNVNGDFPDAIIVHSDVFGQAANYVGSAPGSGCISIDPLFASGSTGNYHLTPSSPALDAALNLGIFEDLEGQPRPQGGGFNMGAYETVQRGSAPGAVILIH